MKKIHIILLVFIAGAIAVLVSFLRGASTYDSIEGAKANPGKFVHVAAKLDHSMPVDYDELKNPNFLSFVAIDTMGQKMKVIYRKGRIENLETSERLVLKGEYQDDHFECKDIQTKCPSKYKDDMKAAEKSIQTNSGATVPENNSAKPDTYRN
jgi:cytochrome c-type biogenesis protein CcmE